MSDVRLETLAPADCDAADSDAAASIRELVLDAPHRRNALNRPMLAELRAAVAEVAADPDARVLIIRGEGASFCAGADLTSLFGDPNREVSVLRRELSAVYASFLSIGDLEIPTIAVVQGAAVGAGANIALASDLIVCGASAKFGITFADIGLHPGGGCTWFLTRALGAQRAKAAILGGEVIGAERAVALGLALEVSDDPLERARALAAQYATRPPELAASMLRCVDVATTADLPTVLELEAWAQASSVTKPTFQEFLASFKTKASSSDHGDAAPRPGDQAYVPGTRPRDVRAAASTDEGPRTAR